MTGGAVRLAAGIGLVLLAGSCSPKAPENGFSAHVSLLSGEVTLPIERWVLNEGVVVEAASFCPPPACQDPSARVAFVATGEAEQALKAELASDKALSARRPPVRTRLLGGGVRVERGKLRAETRIARSLHAGKELTRLTLQPASGRGPVAHVAVLREPLMAGSRFILSIAARPDLALAGLDMPEIQP